MSPASQEQVKQAADVLSVSTAVATVAGWLPAIAALFTIIWTGIRIWESPTMQSWVKRMRG